MTHPSSAAANSLQDALAAELRAAQAIANVTVRAWVKEIAITPDSVYRVLRGKRPVSVVELIGLCRVLGEDPLDLISRAVTRADLKL